MNQNNNEEVKISRKVRVLPQTLADLIAAGEVVERPASVVKELCENAIDASATKITVEAEEGGAKLIRVSDNGSGMTPEDGVLALKRHATSKILTAEDLEMINTLGFRGEALPSIASVSHLEIITRPKDHEAGVKVTTSAGHEPLVVATGCAPGTTISVKSLFYNVPARKKFLKKPKTEDGHIQETLVRIALTKPSIHFRLLVDGKKALELPSHPNLESRSEAILTRRAKGRFFPGEYVLDKTRVTVLLAAPAAAVSSSRWCYFFVNGRFVRDRMLLRALLTGHGGALPSGRYPVAVVHVDLPPDLVDVNVHPQKTEVRFVKGKQVAAAVHNAVKETVARAPWSLAARTYVISKSPETETGSGTATDTDKGTSVKGETHAQGETDTKMEKGSGESQGPDSFGTDISKDPGSALREASRRRVQEALENYSGHRRHQRGQSNLFQGRSHQSIGAQNSSQSRHKETSYSKSSTDKSGQPANPPSGPAAKPGAPIRAWFEKTHPFEQTHQSAQKEPEGPSPKIKSELNTSPDSLSSPNFRTSERMTSQRFGDLIYLGQALKTFIVFEGSDGLIFLDQHAVHERINYNRMMKALSSGDLPSQGLLVPERLELSPGGLETLEEHTREIKRLGFEAEPFGGSSVALKAIPMQLAEEGGDGAGAFLELLDELNELGEVMAEQEENSYTSGTESLVATLACHASIRAGMKLSTSEVAQLLRDMDATSPWDHCPHGRPVVMHLTEKELRKRFGRE